MGLFHPTSSSFKYAFQGIKTALKDEPNFRFHCIALIVVLVLAGVLGFSFWEWVILILVSGFVIVVELINTSVENIVNMVSPEIRLEAKKAKDVAAAAVLLSAITAMGVGAILFVPKIIAILNY